MPAQIFSNANSNHANWVPFVSRIHVICLSDIFFVYFKHALISLLIETNSYRRRTFFVSIIFYNTGSYFKSIKKKEFAQIYFVSIFQMFNRNAYRNDVKLDLRNPISP